MTDDEFLAHCTPAEVILVPGAPGAHVFNFDDVETPGTERFTRLCGEDLIAGQHADDQPE